MEQFLFRVFKLRLYHYVWFSIDPKNLNLRINSSWRAAIPLDKSTRHVEIIRGSTKSEVVGGIFQQGDVLWQHRSKLFEIGISTAVNDMDK